MRELMFRGICLRDIDCTEIGEGVAKAGEFAYGQLVFNNNETYIVGELIDATDEYINVEYWIPVDSDTVGQFTGLTDKKKEDIYEGDIVSVFSQAYDTKRNANTVEYKNASFRYVSLNPNMGDAPCGCYQPRQVEVIGNIHKNPELLEGSHE